MKKNLAKKLIERDVMKFESKAWATVMSKGMTGDPVEVQKELVLTEVNTSVCKGYNTREPKIIFRFPTSSIYRLDGMSLDRLAQAYNLNDDGTKRKTGKKPGRKPQLEKV